MNSSSQGAPTIPFRSVFTGVANFFALGFGLGLAPKAPGTVGTLLGVLLLFVMPLNTLAYAGVLLILFCFGVWCCHQCALQLGVHDHPGIVWDEVVGYLLVMISMPRTLYWVVFGFLLFRLFDIFKPWPIGWIDRRVHGGLGIMLDDVLAGIYAAVVLQLVYQLYT